MNTITRLSVAALACAMVSGAAMAHDATYPNAGVCTLEFESLHAAIDAAWFANPSRDQEGMWGKLDFADAKLGQFKPWDAAQKLGDIRAKAKSLVDGNVRGKIKIEGGEDIVAEAELAMNCVTMNAYSYY